MSSAYGTITLAPKSRRVIENTVFALKDAGAVLVVEHGRSWNDVPGRVVPAKEVRSVGFIGARTSAKNVERIVRRRRRLTRTSLDGNWIRHK